MRLIDLSLEIEPTESEPEPVSIDYISHGEGARILGKSVGLQSEDFPEGMALSLERIRLTSHSGTHLDAPSHYGPICESAIAKNISEIPLKWCLQKGIVLDCSENTELPVSKNEVISALEKKHQKLEPLDIVLIYTGADALWGGKEYFTDFRGISLEATEWIVQQGVKIIGVDSFGFDPPFYRMLDQYQKTKDKQYLWPAHLFGRGKEYCQIERLTNLSSMLSFESFRVSCFPIKIKGAGAGWVRVVAIIDD